MRAREFLFEAKLAGSTITSWPAYLEKLLVSTSISIGDQGEIAQGLSLAPEAKSFIQQGINALKADPNNKAIVSAISNAYIEFSDGSTYKIGQIFKGPDLKGTTAERAEVRSKGLVAEALLGVAMYAKLVARGGDLTAQITAADVWNIVDGIKPQGADVVTAAVNDVSNQVSDNINLSITLAVDVQHLLTSVPHRPMFADTVQSWVTYCNSTLAQRYADALYKNNRPDNITIQLAGKEGGKVDVLMNVLDKNGQPTRKMEQVKLSVKLSDSLIGQQARGKTFDEAYQNLEILFEPLGVNLSSQKKKILNAAMTSGIDQQFVDAMTIAYKEAVKQLTAMAKLPAGDAKLATNVSNLLNWHATHNDPEVQVIEKIAGGEYRILNYKDLKTAFRNNNIDIVVKYIPSASEKLPGKEVPRIIMFDKNNPTAKGRLLEIRFRTRGNYANHIIEPGPLLKELAAYNRFTKK